MKLVSLIGEDLRRIRSNKLASIEEDLEELFEEHSTIYKDYGVIPGAIVNEGGYSIHKVRLAITRPFKPTSKGMRLWIYFDKKHNTYFQCLLYLAKEEDRAEFKKQRCFDKIYERLDSYSKKL